MTHLDFLDNFIIRLTLKINLLQSDYLQCVCLILILIHSDPGDQTCKVPMCAVATRPEQHFLATRPEQRLTISEGVRAPAMHAPSTIASSWSAHASAAEQRSGYVASAGHEQKPACCKHGLTHACPLERWPRPPNGRARPTTAAAAFAWPPSPCQL